MDTAEVIYLGNFRTESTHLQSGNKTISDAPTDNFGKGEFFSPTDLLATSLAQCLITTIGVQTRLEGINIDGAKLSVKKHMSANPRKVSQIDIHILVPAENLTTEQKIKIETIAKNCPVGKSLHPDLIQNINFEYK